MMSGKKYPWYDSPWLSAYVKAKGILERHCPEKLDDFVGAMEVFRTRPDFEAVKLDEVFDEVTLLKIKGVVGEFRSEELEKDELLSFGRQVVHDDPRFTKLQERLTDLVSEKVAEEVEPCYNFLSLYNNLGVCKVHMDAPFAKWTLDFCIEQSSVWPIYFSQVRPWPEAFECQEGQDWQELILNDPGNTFSKYCLEEGKAIIFGGSSQWHYRKRITKAQEKNFCHLLFFHFIPKGTRDLVQPEKWAELFAVPELQSVGRSGNTRSAYSIEDLSKRYE